LREASSGQLGAATAIARQRNLVLAVKPTSATQAAALAASAEARVQVQGERQLRAVVGPPGEPPLVALRQIREPGEAQQAETNQREAQIAHRLLAVLPGPAARQAPMQRVDGPLLAVQVVLEAAPKVAAVREVPRRLAGDRQQGELRRVAQAPEVAQTRVAQTLEAPRQVALPRLNRNWSPRPAALTG
jgi:hypothetical protein